MCLEVDDNQRVILKLWIQAAASKSELAGLYGTPPRLKVRVAAPPVEGAANEEIIRFFAKLLGISKASISFIRGHQSKRKDLLIEGILLDACKSKLGL